MHVLENPDEHPFAVIAYKKSFNKIQGSTPYELVFDHTSSRPLEELFIENAIISKYVGKNKIYLR